VSRDVLWGFPYLLRKLNSFKEVYEVYIYIKINIYIIIRGENKYLFFHGYVLYYTLRPAL